MSKTVVNHHDGSRTVRFGNGKKVTFGARRSVSQSEVSGSPYLFAVGKKIDLPAGISRGMIFEVRNKIYVAITTRTGLRYGQPITLKE